MKSSSLIAIVGLMTVGTSFGASGIFGSYINVTSSNHGGTPTWYDVQPPAGGRASNPIDFNGFSFGSFDPGAGGTFNLTGAEVLTYKDGGSDVTGAAISYRVYLTATTPPGFNSIGIGFTSNSPLADAAGTTYFGGGDQKWSSGVGSTDLLAGLPNGNYSLEVFLSAPSTDGTHFSNAGGANYTASFTVVPESASAALGLLGSILLLRRRK